MQHNARTPNMAAAFPLFAFVIFITPSLSLFSGAALAPAFVLLAIPALLLFFKNKNWGLLYEGTLQKVIIVALCYMLISCIWAISPLKSVKLWLAIFFLAASSFMLFDYVKNFSPEQKEKGVRIFFYGIILAIMIVGIEVATNGFLSNQAHFFKSAYEFHLTDLNRGSSVLSILFWPCVAMFLSRGKTYYAISIGVALLLATSQLESTAAILGLILGVIIAGSVYKFGRVLIKILMICVVIGVMAFPAITTLTSAERMNSVIPTIPGAASMYRIYIWNFAGNKALQKPIFGWGFDASRKIPVQESDYFTGGRYPLPLHPHNNSIQVWLELGLVGMALFMAFLVTILHNIGNCQSRLYMSLGAGLFTTYFFIGQVGYGIWQNWWIAGGLLAVSFLLIKPNQPNSNLAG